MDRFVHSLKGEENEIIERASIQCAATMKEQGKTKQKYNKGRVHSKKKKIKNFLNLGPDTPP